MTDEEYNRLVDAIAAFDGMDGCTFKPYGYYTDEDYMNLAKMACCLKEACSIAMKMRTLSFDNNSKALFQLTKAAYDIACNAIEPSEQEEEA